MKVDIAYLAVTYTAEVVQPVERELGTLEQYVVRPREYEDVGPVLVKTRSYMRFYPVGTDQDWPIPLIGYELMKAYPLGITEDEALQRFAQDFPSQ